MNDVIPATFDIALGGGWGALETHRDEAYRWIVNDAVLFVATLKSVDHEVSVQVEPGPGVGLKPFVLSVLKPDGDTLATLNVKGRETLSFIIPASDPMVHTLVFHTDEGGKTTPGDPRVLNFRIFKIGVQRMPGDVLPAGSGFRLGSGWYPLETFKGESFRWVQNDATIEASASSPSPLQLEIEPGPGVDSKPFTLNVVDHANAPVAAFEVKTRERVAIPLDKIKRPGSLRLRVEGGGKTSGNDKRIMNFRVFEYDAIGARVLATVAAMKGG